MKGGTQKQASAQRQAPYLPPFCGAVILAFAVIDARGAIWYDTAHEKKDKNVGRAAGRFGGGVVCVRG